MNTRTKTGLTVLLSFAAGAFASYLLPNVAGHSSGSTPRCVCSAARLASESGLQVRVITGRGAEFPFEGYLIDPERANTENIGKLSRNPDRMAEWDGIIHVSPLPPVDDAELNEPVNRQRVCQIGDMWFFGDPQMIAKIKH